MSAGPVIESCRESSCFITEDAEDEKELRERGKNERNYFLNFMFGSTQGNSKDGTDCNEDDVSVVNAHDDNINKNTAESIDTSPKKPLTGTNRSSKLLRSKSEALHRSGKSINLSSDKRDNIAVNKDLDFDTVYPANRKNDIFSGSNEAIASRTPSLSRQSSDNMGKRIKVAQRDSSSSKARYTHKTLISNTSLVEKVSLSEFIISRIYSSVISMIPIETSVFGRLPSNVQIGITFCSATVVCIVFTYLFILNYDHFSNFRYVVFDQDNSSFNNGLDYLSNGGYGQSVCTPISKSIGIGTLNYYECRSNSYHVIIMTLGLATACTLLSLPFVALLLLPLLYLYLYAYDTLPSVSLYYKQSKKAALDEIVENLLKHRDSIPDKDRKASLFNDLVSDLVHRVFFPHHSHHRAGTSTSKNQVASGKIIDSNSPTMADDHASIGASEVNHTVEGSTRSTAIIERFTMSSSDALFVLGDDNILNTNDVITPDSATVIENLLTCASREAPPLPPLNIKVNTINIISADGLIDKYAEYMELEGDISDTNANSEYLDSEDEVSNTPVMMRPDRIKKLNVKNVRFEDFEDLEPESHVIDINMRQQWPSFDDVPGDATPVKIAKERYHKRSNKRSSPNSTATFTKPRSNIKKIRDSPEAQAETAVLGGWFNLFMPATPTSSQK